ncbi:hypothetical protein [Endozoicomonas sp. ISHI1]|nr:hypothetical protein [Endozoicomonas sp. ISHI1]
MIYQIANLNLMVRCLRSGVMIDGIIYPVRADVPESGGSVS